MASTAQHSTLRQLTKRIVQVTAFSASCLVVIPSFTQTADAQSCPYNGGCVTGYGGGSSPIEDWSWISDPYGGGGSNNYGNGGSGGSSPPPPPPPPPSPFQTCTTGINSVVDANGHYQAARAWAIAMGGGIAGLAFVAQHPVGSSYIIVYLDGSRGSFLVSCPACGTGNLSTNLGCTP